MTIELRNSILPYPNEWSLSGALPANFVPIMVITELRASDKLLTASTNIAIEFALIPIITLNRASRLLPTIPSMLVFIILFSRSFCNLSSFLKSSTLFFALQSQLYNNKYLQLKIAVQYSAILI